MHRFSEVTASGLEKGSTWVLNIFIPQNRMKIAKISNDELFWFTTRNVQPHCYSHEHRTAYGASLYTNLVSLARDADSELLVASL